MANSDWHTTALLSKYTKNEIELAMRNHGFFESMKYDLTPAGLHYLLIHFDIPRISEDGYRLNIGGLVSNPLSLSLDDIKARPRVTIPVTMECAGNGRTQSSPRYWTHVPWDLQAIGTSMWTGTPLGPLLKEAGLDSSAVEILFTGKDKGVQGGEIQYFQRCLNIAEATLDGVILAYEMNGQPLLPQHGFPLRLIVPGWYGMTSVKWLDRIEAIAAPFNGYQMRAYTYRTCEADPGVRVTLQRVRSLMVPPGIPDFFSRQRLVEAGPVELEGRAWAGRRSISHVVVSTDGCRTWSEAKLGASIGSHAWVRWTFMWKATPGRHVLSVRATDDHGDEQPLEQFWNLYNMANNVVQRLEVKVCDKLEEGARAPIDPPRFDPEGHDARARL